MELEEPLKFSEFGPDAVELAVIDWIMETPMPRRDSPLHGSCDVVGFSETPTEGSVTPMPTN